MPARTPNLALFTRITRIALVALVCLPVALGGGCRTTPVYVQGPDQIPAIYTNQKLEATLPRRITVPSVVAAAQRVLRGRGLVITAAEATTQRGRVVARPHGGKLFHKTRVDARQTRRGTLVIVETEPRGDEPASRAILDDLLTTLGM